MITKSGPAPGQIDWGGINKFWGDMKTLILWIRECGPKNKDLHCNFPRILGWNQKKRVFIAKSAKKQFLLMNSRVITSTLGISGLELHYSGSEPVTFFGSQSSLGDGGTILVWRGTSSDLGGSRPGNAPLAPGLNKILLLLHCHKETLNRPSLLEGGSCGITLKLAKVK